MPVSPVAASKGPKGGLGWERTVRLLRQNTKREEGQQTDQAPELVCVAAAPGVGCKSRGPGPQRPVPTDWLAGAVFKGL